MFPAAWAGWLAGEGPRREGVALQGGRRDTAEGRLHSPRGQRRARNWRRPVRAASWGGRLRHLPGTSSPCSRYWRKCPAPLSCIRAIKGPALLVEQEKKPSPPPHQQNGGARALEWQCSNNRGAEPACCSNQWATLPGKSAALLCSNASWSDLGVGPITSPPQVGTGAGPKSPPGPKVGGGTLRSRNPPLVPGGPLSFPRSPPLPLWTARPSVGGSKTMGRPPVGPFQVGREAPAAARLTRVLVPIVGFCLLQQRRDRKTTTTTTPQAARTATGRP